MSPATTPTVALSPEVRQGRILLIDDEPLNVEIFSAILREAGFQHLAAVTDPREALQRYAEFDPDLIVLDLRMPHLDGFMLLQKFRAQTSTTGYLPILVLTADWTPEARHRALACGASDFLTRPLDNTEIILRVGNLLATRQLHAQLARHAQDLEAAVAVRTTELQAAHDRLQQETAGRAKAEEALRRRNDFVHLLDVITVAASQSAPVHQTFQVALEQVCLSMGWEIGHALKRSAGGTLISAGLWHLRESTRTAEFRAASEEIAYTPGSGLPGRVLASRQPAWIIDLASDINFRRTGIAADLGLRSAFALPVLIGSEVVSVLEFFSTGTRPPNHEMLEAMQHIGAQLGRVLERQRSEEALRSSEAKFRSFAQLGSDAIVLADAQGHIISWNHGAQQIFGYSEEEALGHSILMLLPTRLRPEFDPGAELLAQTKLLRLIGRRAEFVGQRKDGSEFPMELALDVWTTWDGSFCSGVVRDVSSRKAMEESLCRNEERMRRLLGATKVIPWSLDFAAQRVTEIGPQIVALLGYELEAWMVPGFWSARLHPEDRDWVLRHCEEALEHGRSFELEHRLIAAGGRTVWVQALASVDGDPAERTLRGFLLDISPQKQAQEALREYAAVIESSHEAIVGATLEGTITSWNKGAEQLCGYTQGEVLGRSVGLILPGNTFGEAPQNALTLLARGEHCQDRETVFRHKNGTLVDVLITLSPLRDAHGRVSGICGIARDNSERKRAAEELRRSHDRLEAEVAQRTQELRGANEQLRTEIAERREVELALRGSEGRLKTLIASVDEIIFEFDGEGQGSTFWAGDQQLTTLLQQQLGGRSIEELFAESLGGTFHETVRRVLQTGRPETVEHTIDLAGGRRWFLSRVAPLAGADGVARSVCLLARDITHRQLAEESLRSAMTEAERANTAKTNFLSRMSHELRTPLNAILGFAQLLDRQRMPEEDREGVDQILGSGQHLLGLINEVLDMARIEVGRLTLSLEPIHSHELVAEALSLVRASATARQITLIEGECPWAIIADRQRLRQVLLNFLTNAVKYNQPGGRVSVQCQALPEGLLRLAVTDTGGGIPVEKLDSLFKPFERLETHPAAVEGIGLGLAISKRLIELMGGTIGVESEYGSGCTFWLTVPLASPEQAAEVAEGDAPLDAELGLMALGPCSVLYIEDNLSNLMLVERLLARQPDVQLLAATHGQPGLELAIRYQPAAILLDLHLPDMPGLEVLTKLRAEPRTAHIPVIVTSADPLALDARRLDAAQIQGFVSKPLDLASITQVLKKALGEGCPRKAEP